MTMFSKLYNDVREKLKTEPGDIDDDVDPKIKCSLCISKSRLLDFHALRKGNHICMAGHYFTTNVGDKQVSMYSHHAIVKDVEIVSRGTAMVTLIHFYSTPYNMAIQVQETTELLDLYHHEMYMIKYRHATHAPDIIVQRAERLIQMNKDAKYSLLNCNCEHFCNWCSVGNQDSFQVQNAKDNLRDIMFAVGNIGGKVLKVIFKLISLSIDDLSQLVSGACVGVPWGVLCLTGLIFLLYTIHLHRKLLDEQALGKICSTCCLRAKQDNWIRFGAFCILQVGGLGLMAAIIAAGASKGIIFGALAVCSVLTLVITKLVPTLRRLFFSPFNGKRVKVWSLSKIWIGDVISFDHWGISHEAVVSSVNIKRREITVIHYSLPRLFGRRQVVEETIKVDLKKDHIVGHDYSGYRTHPPEVVVKRAKQRIGETKFGIMSNRSCHFCYWAKVDEDIELDLEMSDESSKLQFIRSINPYETLRCWPEVNVNHTRKRVHATKDMGRTWARIPEEVKVGQIVEFKYRGFWHKAVSTEVTFDETCDSLLYLTVVHYGNRRTVCEETLSFDFNYEDVWIHMVHPMNRFRKEDVVRRARARIGQRKYNIFNYRATHLANEIVRKDLDTQVNQLDELNPGDGITFYYWSLAHDAIVTKVKSGDSKPNISGNVTVIHYALDHLLATRTIKEEAIEMDLRKDRVYIRDYVGYVTYPSERVVKRARSRCGEQRFSAFGNTSSDLVHWAKVIQSPAIIATSSKGEYNMPMDSKEYLLVPTAGKKHDDFQIFTVHAWSDLKLGTLVEYNYYWIAHHGIVSHVDEKRCQIKVIHYGAQNLFATRTIMEDTLKLNLKTDTIKMYRAHPAKTNKIRVILGKARRRLGEQEWGYGNRSWDFCLDCMLKQTTKEQ